MKESYQLEQWKRGWKLPVMPVSDFLNPFGDYGVKTYAVLGYESLHRSLKYFAVGPLLKSALDAGILIPGKTKLIEATSGQTGVELSQLAKAKPYECPEVILVMKGDVPEGKKWAVRMTGAKIVHPRGNESPIEMARALGGGGWRPEEEGGWHCGPDGVLNLDQYSNPANGLGYAKEVMPKIVAQVPDCTILCVPVGTGGTVVGLSTAFRAWSHNVTIVGAMCRRNEEIPGVRDLDAMKLIRQPWQEAIDWRITSFARPAYLSSYWFHLAMDATPGVSGGMSYYCAQAFIAEQIRKRTLDRFRSKVDGNVHVVVIFHDEARPYLVDRFPTYIHGDWWDAPWSSKTPKPWELFDDYPVEIEKYPLS